MEHVIGGVAYRMRTRGRELAQKLSQIAQGWGNKFAAEWLEDLGFIRYLTVMEMNQPIMFRAASRG